MPLTFVSQGSNIYKYSNKFFFFSSYSFSVIAPISFKSNKSFTCLITSDRNFDFSAAVVVEFPTYKVYNMHCLFAVVYCLLMTVHMCMHESYGLHCLNTCSTEFEFPSPGAKAETIVSPTALIVSARLSRLGRFAGLALNIGTSGIVSLVAVPTICRKIHVTINTKILLMNIFICLFLALQLKINCAE